MDARTLVALPMGVPNSDIAILISWQRLRDLGVVHSEREFVLATWLQQVRGPLDCGGSQLFKGAMQSACGWRLRITWFLGIKDFDQTHHLGERGDIQTRAIT